MKRHGRPPYPDLLTPRQQEVIGLLRQGLTNGQIGNRLGISLDRAKYHVSEIIGKLGVSSRAEALAWQAGSRPWWAGVAAFVSWPFNKFSWAPALKISACLGLLASAGMFSGGGPRPH